MATYRVLSTNYIEGQGLLTEPKFFVQRRFLGFIWITYQKTIGYETYAPIYFDSIDSAKIWIRNRNNTDIPFKKVEETITI